MIGQAGGLNYQLPQGGLQGQGFIQAPEAITAMPTAQGQAMLPPMNEDLAYVEGLTDRYYDTYGKLKGFVTQMNQMGIDVTKPDYADPSKMELFKAYKKLEADLMMTANDLKQSRQAETKYRDLEAQRKFVMTADPRQQLLSRMAPGEIGYSLDLDPRTEYGLRILSENPMNPQDKARQEQFYNSEINFFNNQIANTQDPNEQKRLAFQRDQLTKAYQATKMFAPTQASAARLNFDSKVQGAAELVKQATRVIKGVGYDQQGIVDGKAVNISNQYQGMMLSPERRYSKKSKKFENINRKISFTYQAPDGRIFARFEPTDVTNASGQVVDTIQPTDEEIGTREPLAFIEELSNNNQNFIGKFDEFVNLAKTAGVANQGVADIPVITKNMQLTGAPKELDAKFQKEKANIKRTLDNGGVYVLPNTGDMTVRIRPIDESDASWYNPFSWGDKKRRFVIEVDGEPQATVDTSAEAQAVLAEKGFFDIMLGIKTNKTAVQPTQQAPETDPDI
jgi:hypothetical protein